MPQAIFAYHLGMDAEQYAFFRIPKLLITEPYFRRLSTDAKLLYGLMLDRMSLSMRNGWMDDDGHVYIYFTLEEACEQLCCKTDKAVKLFAELDSAKGVGLIRRVKQGLGRPAKIYVLRFMGIEDEPGEDEQLYLAEAQNSGLRDYSKTNAREYFADSFDYWIAYSGSEKRMETFRNAAPQTWAYFEALEKNNWRS